MEIMDVQTINRFKILNGQQSGVGLPFFDIRWSWFRVLTIDSLSFISADIDITPCKYVYSACGL